MKRRIFIVGTIIIILILITLYIRGTSNLTNEINHNDVKASNLEEATNNVVVGNNFEKIIDNISIQLIVPINWKYEEFSQNTENDFYKYALKIYEDDENRYAVLYYFRQPFAVCGTGRTSKEIILNNGNKAIVGYYDDNNMWQDISFFESNEHIAILNDKLNQEESEEFLDFIKTINIEELKEINGCKYKHFKPTFNKDGKGPDTYDYTQDMEYKDKFYHKLISNYEEYMIYKTRWNDICYMDEQDFENNVMVITAIENTSMLGLDICEIHNDEDILYIDFDVSEENYDKNETCNSIIIPNSFKCESIEVRDLRNIKETPEYIYGWKDESIEGMKMISEDVAVKIAKEYAKSLVNSDSLLGQWLEKYTKVYEVSLTKKHPNNYWLLKKDDSNTKHLVASYERTVYEIILVPYDDDVEVERAHFYVDAYTGKVIGGMQTGD